MQTKPVTLSGTEAPAVTPSTTRQAQRPSDAAVDNRDASGLQSLLHREFKPREADRQPAAPEPAAKTGKFGQPSASRWLKTVAGLAIVATVGWMPMQRLFQVSSVEAVVNAPVVTLRAPIAGTVEAAFARLHVGSTIEIDEPLLEIRNLRASANALDQANVALVGVRAERAAVASRLDEQVRTRAVVASRVENFRSDRSRKVAAELDAADARIAAAEGHLKRVTLEHERQTALAAKRKTTRTARRAASIDVEIAAAGLREATASRAALAVEADVLGAGRFLGDDYNDEPRSAQQLDELDQSIASARADIVRLDQRIDVARTTAERERQSYELSGNAGLVAPVGGRIWEILTAPGEQVVAGQHLASVIDCSKLMVTAAVSEAVYNTLAVGQPASFTFREGGKPLKGSVVQLSGVSSAPSNFAIQPSALTKEPYRASVLVDISSLGSCPVGQTGRVVFATQQR